MQEVLIVIAQFFVWFICQAITFVFILKYIKQSYTRLELSLIDFIVSFLISIFWIVILPFVIFSIPFYFLYKKVKES